MATFASLTSASATLCVDVGCVLRAAACVLYAHARFAHVACCLCSQIHWATTQTVDTLTHGAVPLSLNAELTVGLPYALPLFLVVLALAAIALSLCSSSLSKYFACTLSVCSFIVLPFFFIVAGGMFFPTVIVSTDICTSARNLAFSYVARSPDVVCGAISAPYSVIGNSDEGVCTCLSLRVSASPCLCLSVCRGRCFSSPKGHTVH